jgi:hypothetical protein
VRFALPQLRNDIGIKKIGHYARSCGARRRTFPRSGTERSPRDSDARSNAFRPGRALAVSRRHSSTRTSTAASAPRIVTSWGPWVRLACKSSLKRALASWTGQLFIRSIHRSYDRR